MKVEVIQEQTVLVTIAGGAESGVAERAQERDFIIFISDNSGFFEDKNIEVGNESNSRSDTDDRLDRRGSDDRGDKGGNHNNEL